MSISYNLLMLSEAPNANMLLAYSPVETFHKHQLVAFLYVKIKADQIILTVSILFFIWFYRTISRPGGGNGFTHPNRSCACARVCARAPWIPAVARMCCVNRSGRHLRARGASTWVELAAAQPITGLPMGGRALAGRSPG